MRISRLVQVQAAIMQRREFRTYERSRLIEWQTKQLGSVIAALAPSAEGQKLLGEHVSSFSLVGDPVDTKKNEKQPKKIRTIYGDEISAKDRANYSYEEIDHSEQEQASVAKARSQNAGKDMSSILGGFTKQ